MATSWSQIVREQGPLVYQTAWRILAHQADVEDVVQEVFLQFYQWQQTRPVRHAPALLRRMAACRALDRLRQRRQLVPLEDLILPTSSGDPEAQAMEQELRERLRQAIASLPEREAEVFCLRYFDDLSYQEMAELLHIRTGAVAAALHKARTKLEAILLAPNKETSREPYPSAT